MKHKALIHISASWYRNISGFLFENYFTPFKRAFKQQHFMGQLFRQIDSCLPWGQRDKYIQYLCIGLTAYVTPRNLTLNYESTTINTNTTGSGPFSLCPSCGCWQSGGSYQCNLYINCPTKYFLASVI
jgi:hypothetical protein